MPARQNGQTTGSRSGIAPYWKRLQPLAEYEYHSDSGKPLAEIVVFDDREETDTVYVQVFPLVQNGRRAKGAVLRMDTIDRVTEIADDMVDAVRLLQVAT